MRFTIAVGWHSFSLFKKEKNVFSKQHRNKSKNCVGGVGGAKLFYKNLIFGTILLTVSKIFEWRVQASLSPVHMGATALRKVKSRQMEGILMSLLQIRSQRQKTFVKKKWFKSLLWFCNLILRHAWKQQFGNNNSDTPQTLFSKWINLFLFRGVFRTPSNIYNGDFLRK